ncbi:MAG: helix-turn-helix domain-containing protein [Candidatus Bathyarchaeia archaeon]
MSSGLIGTILDVLGNETRRKILRLLADEPHYLLQLAGELNVSQQAILKHLNILEKHGIISSFKAESDFAAPPRKYYELSKSLCLMIGMSKNLVDFEMREIVLEEELSKFPEEFNEILFKIEGLGKGEPITQALKNAKSLLKEIDSRIKRLRETEILLLKLKQKLMEKTHEIIRESSNDLLERGILYSLLKIDGKIDIDLLSEKFNVREKEIKKAVKSLKQKDLIMILE